MPLCSYDDDASTVLSFSLGVLFVEKIKGDSLTHRKENNNNNNNREQNDNNMKENRIGSLFFSKLGLLSPVRSLNNRTEERRRRRRIPNNKYTSRQTSRDLCTDVQFPSFLFFLIRGCPSRSITIDDDRRHAFAFTICIPPKHGMILEPDIKPYLSSHAEPSDQFSCGA